MALPSIDVARSRRPTFSARPPKLLDRKEPSSHADARIPTNIPQAGGQALFEREQREFAEALVKAEGWSTGETRRSFRASSFGEAAGALA